MISGFQEPPGVQWDQYVEFQEATPQFKKEQKVS
jgi:hypothetical protein